MDISSPTDPTVLASLAYSCDLCQAPKGELCRNTIQPGKPLPGRAVHYGRLVDRRRQPKEDK